MIKLNSQMQLNELPAMIISRRLAELQQCYGGMALKKTFVNLSKRQPTKYVFNFKENDEPDIQLEVHLINLCETYGKTAVKSLYESIWTLDVSKKTA